MAQAQKDKVGPQGTRMFRLQDVPEVETVVEPEIEAAAGVTLRGKSPSVRNQIFPLRKGSNNIGRKDNNDVHLPHDSVSAQHARISQHDGVWQVTNLLSSNGTFVNGERITRRQLEDGDEVSFGDSVFMFRNRASAQRAFGLRFGLFAAAAIAIVSLTTFLII